MTFSQAFAKQPPSWIFAEATVLMGFVGLFDFYTGYEVSLSILYGIPIYAVTWYCDKKAGILMSLLAGLIWWWANMASGHPYLQSWHEGWETFVRLAFFIFIAIGADALRSEREAAIARISLLEHSQRLEQEIIRISEREQQRIGQDLHDGLCQYLAALGCAAASLQGDLEKRQLQGEAESARELVALLKDAVVQTRDAARGLVPLHLSEAGLESTLEGLALSVSRLQGINCTFDPNNSPINLDGHIAMHLYRIAQEAINNASKHGKAQNIVLSLQVVGEVTTLRISDDGRGITTSALRHTGMGLKIMNYRARLSGGELKVEERPAGGTIVRCSIWPKHIVNESAA